MSDTAKASTRAILAIMRTARGPLINGVKLSRAHGRRRYFLHVGDGVAWEGHVAMYDATRRELWVKPHAYCRAEVADNVAEAIQRLRAIQHEHGRPLDYGWTATPDHRTYQLDRPTPTTGDR